ncbi:hypothetical protein HAX54_031642 [Datura stramonium]|uniref:Uncharacterized protein n=1 Tax=Datura stramonium TaxID=4076 RepID=A0ABS8SC00_DATST|nr:hypothetical protein [Datura stramonium]
MGEEEEVMREEEEGEVAIMVVRCFSVLGSGSDLSEIGMVALMAEVRMKRELEGVRLVGHGGCATAAVREKREERVWTVLGNMDFCRRWEIERGCCSGYDEEREK